MIVRAMTAEWTKLRSTSSFWWLLIVFLLISVMVTMISPINLWWVVNNRPNLIDQMIPLDPYSATVSMRYMGFIVILVQATMVVTTEYRYGMAQSNFLATPRRWEVAIAKTATYALIAAVLVLATILINYLLPMAVLPEPFAGMFTPFSDPMGRYLLWAYPVAAIFMVIFAQGVGWLIRHTAGSIVVTIILFFGIDIIIKTIPKIGEHLANAMPFGNLNRFLDDMSYPGTDLPSWFGLLVFVLWAGVLWGTGVVLLERRDT